LRLTSSELGSTLTNRGSPECAVEGVVIDEEGSCEVGRQMPMTTSNSKYAVGEIHKASNPMAERSTTVTRRVQPARGKGFCEAETSNADNDVKPEALRRRGQRGLKSDGREVCNRHEKNRDATLSRRWEAIVQTSAGHKSGALFTHLALVTKYVVREIHRDSDPMAERSATVTRRVQRARGKRFCEVETSNANNDVNTRSTASERSMRTPIRWRRGLQPSQEEFNLQEGRASARLRR